MIRILLVIALLLIPSSIFATSTPPAETPRVTSFDFFTAKVIQSPTEKIDLEYGQFKIIQDIPVSFSSGTQSLSTTLPYEIVEGMPGTARLEQDDHVILGKDPYSGLIFISDVLRLPWLYGLLAMFFGLVFLTAGWGGLRAIGGLLISLLVIGGFVVPYILAGHPPLLIGTVGIIAIASLSTFVAHGLKPRTTIAFLSITLTTSLALLLSLGLTKAMHLFGLSNDAAFYLQQNPETALNLQGILVVGIVIGVLGVLDDITTAQAAIVDELHQANPSLSRSDLYKRASSVGKEHIISLVNTLVLAYAGVSLPLLLLFSHQDRPWWLIINSELVMEELVRMIIGSMALLIAVPLTTYLAAWWFSRKQHASLPQKK